MLENPEILQEMIKETGAKSTDLQSPESAEHLCSKCEAYACEWKQEGITGRNDSLLRQIDLDTVLYLTDRVVQRLSAKQIIRHCFFQFFQNLGILHSLLG